MGGPENNVTNSHFITLNHCVELTKSSLRLQANHELSEGEGMLRL